MQSDFSTKKLQPAGPRRPAFFVHSLGSAQSFFTVLQFGVAIVALLTFGWLAAAWGAMAFFASAGLAAIGAMCVWGAMLIRRREA